jgi:hypothetical protein
METIKCLFDSTINRAISQANPYGLLGGVGEIIFYLKIYKYNNFYFKKIILDIIISK